MVGIPIVAILAERTSVHGHPARRSDGSEQGQRRDDVHHDHPDALGGCRGHRRDLRGKRLIQR